MENTNFTVLESILQAGGADLYFCGNLTYAFIYRKSNTKCQQAISITISGCFPKVLVLLRQAASHLTSALIPTARSAADSISICSHHCMYDKQDMITVVYGSAGCREDLAKGEAPNVSRGVS
jgi:hypothetical protein